jgi:hypothetical protein
VLTDEASRPSTSRHSRLSHEVQLQVCRRPSSLQPGSLHLIRDRGAPSARLSLRSIDISIHRSGGLPSRGATRPVTRLRIWYYGERGGHSRGHSPGTTRKTGGDQADGTADLTSKDDTRRHPVDGREPSHNRRVVRTIVDLGQGGDEAWRIRRSTWRIRLHRLVTMTARLPPADGPKGSCACHLTSWWEHGGTDGQSRESNQDDERFVGCPGSGQSGWRGPSTSTTAEPLTQWTRTTPDAASPHQPAHSTGAAARPPGARITGRKRSSVVMMASTGSWSPSIPSGVTHGLWLSRQVRPLTFSTMIWPARPTPARSQRTDTARSSDPHGGMWSQARGSGNALPSDCDRPVSASSTPSPPQPSGISLPRAGSDLSPARQRWCSSCYAALGRML